MLIKSDLFKRFTKNFTWLFVFNLLGYVFSILTFPLLISKYGLNEVGYIFTLQAIVFGLSAIANYSLPFYIPTLSKQICESNSQFIYHWSLSLYIRFFFSVIVALLSVVIIAVWFFEHIIFWLLSLSLLLPKVISPNLFYNALENNKPIFQIGFYSKLLFLILLFFSDRSLLVLPFLALSELGITLLFIKVSQKELFLRTQQIPVSELIKFVKKTFNLFLINFFSMIKPQALMPFINVVLGSQYVALYAIADKIVNVIRSISGNVYTSFFAIYTKNSDRIKILSIKHNLMLTLITTLFAFIVWHISDYLVYFINDFVYNEASSKTLKILSLSIPGTFLIIPIFSYLLQNKKWNALLLFALLQFLMQIIVLLTIKKMSISTIAISVVVSEYFLYLLYLGYIQVVKKKIIFS